MSNKTNIILFIFLTFLITWGIEIPAALASHGVLQLKVPRMLNQFATFSPGVVAILLSIINIKEGGFKKLIKGVMKFKVPFKAYGFAIFTGSIVAGISLVIYSLLFKSPISLLPFYTLFIYLLLFFFFSPFWEELGWRGYLLPCLLTKFNSLKSSLIIGFIWAMWHLPIFFVLNNNGDQTPMFTFLIFIGCFPLSILFTRLYNYTRGSIFLCMLFHDGINSGIGYFLGNSKSNDVRGIAISVIIFFILSFFALKKLNNSQQLR